MLGTELRTARIAAGLTQEALADAAGVDRTYVSILERDLQSPTLDVFVRLCRAVQVKPSHMLAQIEARYVRKPRKRRATFAKKRKPS